MTAAEEHLRAADPVMARLLDRVGSVPPGRRTGVGPADHYGALVRSIVGQQLSTTVARRIFERLVEHFGGHVPTPQEVLGADPDEMRVAGGLSRAKTSYLRSLAEHVVSGDLELERLADLPDETVIAELTAVRGLGVWTAHMFLMFHLDRPDVLPTGDLGIRKAAMIEYELEALPRPPELEALAEPWRPHRTAACRLLWRSLANEPT